MRRLPYERARKSPYVHRHDYIGSYVADLTNVVDMEAIRLSGVKIGIDPLGGACARFWQPIIERYGIAATIVSDAIDPRFRFMTADWDGKIRMDCSSPYAMARLVGMRDKFDVAFANDTDADRHGIVTRSNGLMNPNHYLAVAISYLYENRPDWSRGCAVGKTVVSSGIIDRVTAKLDRKLVELPVGFKWFVDGFIDSSLGFAGEESAGASFLRRDGSAWTTDKDGIILGLLAAEITAQTERDPSEVYSRLTRELGAPFYERIDASATPEQKELLKMLSPNQIGMTALAGDPRRPATDDILTIEPPLDCSINGTTVFIPRKQPSWLTRVRRSNSSVCLQQCTWLVDAGVIYQTVQAAQLLSRIYRRFPIPFLRHILPYECCGIAKFGCKLAALRLKHIANDDPRSFCGEQASLGFALSACSSTDEYDFAFEAIHFVLHLLEERRCCVSCDAEHPLLREPGANSVLGALGRTAIRLR